MKWPHFIFGRHLEEGEKIYFIAHRHWVAVLPKVLKHIFFYFLLPWIIYLLFPPTFFGVAIIMIIGGVKFLYDFIDWYMDVWIATSHAVIDVDWKGIFHYTSSRIEYPSIEGVSYQIVGFWGTILNYGDTQINKISSTNPVELPCTAAPKYVETKILECKEKFMDSKSKTDGDVLKGILADMVAHHVREKGWKSVKDLKKIQL